VSDFKAEPDNVFTQEQWAEVARSIFLPDLNIEMKQAISEALFDHLLMSSSPPKVKQALTKLARLLPTFHAELSKLQDDVRPEAIINQVEALIEQARDLQKAVQLELDKRPKERGGRPRQRDRDALVERLICVYAQFSSKPVRLSRNSNNRPSGPCYRFISTILKLSQIPTRGIEHIIERERDMPKTRRPK
jgi:hypothetical protein